MNQQQAKFTLIINRLQLAINLKVCFLMICIQKLDIKNPELLQDQTTINSKIRNIKQHKNKIKMFINRTPTKKHKISKQFQNNISLDQSKFKINQQNQSFSSYNHIQQKINQTQLYNVQDEEYLSDFQSLKETLKMETQNQIENSKVNKYTLQHKKHIKIQTANKQTNNCREKVFKKKHVKTKSSVPTILPQINKKRSSSIVKTQQFQQFQEEICRNCIQKFILMKQSPSYLQQQNQKMIEYVQSLRKMLPTLKQNVQTLNIQSEQLKILSQHQDKLLSVQYELKIDKKITENIQTRLILQNKIRKSAILCAKKDIKHSFNQDNSKLNPQISKLLQVRQRLLYAKRISNLYEQKQQNVDKKLSMYETLHKKIAQKLATNRMQLLQKTKLCLQFQIQKKRNQTKLLQIQKQLEIQMLQSQIYQTEGQIQFSRSNSDNNKQLITRRQSEQAKSSRLANINVNVNIDKQEFIRQEIQTYQEEFQIAQEIQYQPVKDKMKQTYSIHQQSQQKFKDFSHKNNAENKVKHEKLLKKLQASNIRIKINTLASSNFANKESQNLFQGEQF